MFWLRRALGRLTTLSLLTGTAPRAQSLGAQPAVTALQVRETSLGSRPTDMVPGTFTFSSALHVAYIRKTTRGEQVVVNAIPGALFASIPRVRLSESGPVNSVSFSANGKRVAYVAIVNNKSVMVVDGVAGAPFDYIGIGSAYFSPDSRHVTYIGKRGDKQYMVWDGRAGTPYDAIGVRHATFTADCKHIVFTATRGEQHFMVMDTRELTGAEYVGDPKLDKTGTRVAYVVMRNNEWSVVVDGVEGRRYRSIGNNLIFTEDGKHLLYRGSDASDHIVLDGMERAGFPSIRENSYNMSSDGRHAAFVSTKEGRDFWIMDGVAQKMYVTIAKRGSQWGVFADGQQRATSDQVPHSVRTSTDGKLLVYIGNRNGKQFVWANGKESAPYDELQFLTISPDEKHITFVATRGKKQFVVLDGIESANYDEVLWLEAEPTPGTPTFSFLARRGNIDIRGTVAWNAATVSAASRKR